MLAANPVADLDAWLRLLTLHDQEGPADAEPETMRFCLSHLPARLAAHAHRRFLTYRGRTKDIPGEVPERLEPALY